MDTGTLIILVVFVVFCVIAGIVIYKKQQKLLSEGKIVKRAGGFYGMAEEFTLRHVAPEEVRQGVEAFSLSSMGVKAAYSQNPLDISFAASWTARLKETSSEEESSVYTFEFTSWSCSGKTSIPKGVTDMNQLLTAVEKLFLQLDPETKVRTYPIKTKTKHSFF